MLWFACVYGLICPQFNSGDRVGFGGSCGVLSTTAVLESSMMQWQISLLPLDFSIFWRPLNKYESFWNAEHLHVFFMDACSSRL